MASLGAAAEALEAGDLEGALAALLAAWRENRAPGIAALIDLLSPRVSPPLPPAKGKRRQEHHAWMSAAAERAPKDVAWLLETATVGTLSEVIERFAMLASWPADPRVSEALLKMVEEPPFPGESARARFWPDVFDLIVRIGDPRAVERLGAARAHSARLQQVDLHRWLVEFMDGALASLSELAPPAEPDPALLERIRGRLPEAPMSATAREDEKLLAAIAASPRADGPKLVYADRLLERGDPRGEFIMLQFKLAEGKGVHDDLRRSEELAEKHGKTWLGELGPYVASPVFEKGFLAEGRLEGDPPFELATRLPGHPLLATAKRLRRGGLEAELFRKILSHPSRERYAGTVEEEIGLEVVLAGTFPRLRVVTLSGFPVFELSRVSAAVTRGALPALRELRLDLDGAERLDMGGYEEPGTDPDALRAALRELTTGALSKRLSVARITVGDTRALAKALPFLDPGVGEASALVRRELVSPEMPGGYLARGRDGTWSKLGLEWESTRVPVEWLKTLKGRRFERLILKPTGLLPSQLSGLKKAVAALGPVGERIFDGDLEPRDAG